MKKQILCFRILRAVHFFPLTSEQVSSYSYSYSYSNDVLVMSLRHLVSRRREL
jgi:hypothetical protein